MTSRSFSGSLFVLLTASLAVAQTAPHEAIATRVRAVVYGYGALVKELDLDHLPGNIPDYPLITEWLNEFGGQLEELSRVAGRDTVTEEQWRYLDARSTKLLAELTYLRCQSLPLRVWGYFDSHDYRKPQWGLAVDTTLAPLSRLKGAFVATAGRRVELTGQAGESVHAQVILVPLSTDLRAVGVWRTELQGPAKIRAEQVRCDFVYYARFPEVATSAGDEWWRGRVLAGKVDVPRELTQAYILTIDIPADAKAGEYHGEVAFRPTNARALAAMITLEVMADK